MIVTILVLVVVAIGGWIAAAFIPEHFENRTLLVIAGVVAVAGMLFRVFGYMKMFGFNDFMQIVGMAFLAAAIFWVAGWVRVDRGLA